MFIAFDLMILFLGTHSKQLVLNVTNSITKISSKVPLIRVPNLKST